MLASPDEDRRLIEAAVDLLRGGAPPGWATLHLEFSPGGPASSVSAVVVTDGYTEPVQVVSGVVDLLVEYCRRTPLAGLGGRRLVIDCRSDGFLELRDGPAAAGPAGGAVDHRRLWLRRVLVAMATVYVIGAVLLFGVGRWFALPARVERVPLPVPSARQQEATEVITDWYEATNVGDLDTLRNLVCEEPGPRIVAEIREMESSGPDKRVFFPVGASQFHDEGNQVRVEFVSRVRPLDETWRKMVESAQDSAGGFISDEFVLTGAGGALKVCDY